MVYEINETRVGTILPQFENNLQNNNSNATKQFLWAIY